MSPCRITPASLFLFLFLLSACGPAAPVLGPPSTGAAFDYDDALATWTRRARIYRNFESRVNVAATYLSLRFRAAMATEHQRIFTTTTGELETWTASREVEFSHNEVFFLAVSTANREWNDLDLHGSIWKLYLETDRGDKVSPTRIVAVRGHPPVVAHLFPDLGHFGEGYLVYFPRYAKHGERDGLPRPIVDQSLSWLRIKMRSPVAAVDLTWEFGSD